MFSLGAHCVPEVSHADRCSDSALRCLTEPSSHPAADPTPLPLLETSWFDCLRIHRAEPLWTTGCSPEPSAGPSKCRGCCAVRQMEDGGSPALALPLKAREHRALGTLGVHSEFRRLKVAVTREAEGHASLSNAPSRARSHKVALVNQCAGAN